MGGVSVSCGLKPSSRVGRGSEREEGMERKKEEQEKGGQRGVGRGNAYSLSLPLRL